MQEVIFLIFILKLLSPLFRYFTCYNQLLVDVALSVDVLSSVRGRIVTSPRPASRLSESAAVSLCPSIFSLIPKTISHTTILTDNYQYWSTGLHLSLNNTLYIPRWPVTGVGILRTRVLSKYRLVSSHQQILYDDIYSSEWPLYLRWW